MNTHWISSLAAFSLLALVLSDRVVSTQGNPAAAALKNPVAATPESLAAGKRAYDANCAACHGNRAQGSDKAGVVDLDHPGAGRQAAARPDRRQVGPRLDRRRDLHRHQEGRAADDDGGMGRADLRHRDLEHRQLPARARGEPAMWRSTAAPTAAATPATPRKTLELADYVADADHRRPRGDHTRGQLARVNFMRDEPGGRRFFVNDLNGPLYILDKQTKQFTTYLDFNGLAGRPGLFAEADLRAQLRHRPHQRRLRSRLRAQRRLLHDPHGGSDDRGARRAEGRASCPASTCPATGRRRRT